MRSKQVDFCLMLWYNIYMKCKHCEFENSNPPKWGKDRHGIQLYRCQSCRKVFPDPTEYLEWETTRQRAPNKTSNKNEFDEYMTYAICKVLKKLEVKEINGIGSSYSIAALLECPASTIQLWLKKYKDTTAKPERTMTKLQLSEYVKSKKFGLGILDFLADSLPYGVLAEIDEIKKARENAEKPVRKFLSSIGAKELRKYKDENVDDDGKEWVTEIK